LPAGLCRLAISSVAPFRTRARSGSWDMTQALSLGTQVTRSSPNGYSGLEVLNAQVCAKIQKRGFGAGSGGRTHKSSRTADFKSAAVADSASPAERNPAGGYLRRPAPFRLYSVSFWPHSLGPALACPLSGPAPDRRPARRRPARRRRAG